MCSSQGTPAVARMFIQCWAITTLGARTSLSMAAARPSAHDLADLVHELRVERVTLGRDASVGDRFENRAARLVQVMAVVEAAMREQRPELGERALQRAFGQVIQPELLETRRIDQRAAARQLVETRERRGMASAVERGGDLARGRFRVRNQQIHERRFAHARLAEQDRLMAVQMRGENRMRFLRMLLLRHFEHRIAERAIALQSLARERQHGFQVDLVEQDDRREPVGLGGHERAPEQVFAEVRLGGEHDQQLVEIRREELRLELVGAIEQIAPLADRHDHALVGRRRLIVDAVAHRDLALLAARKALERRAAAVGRDEIMAAVCRDHDAVQRGRRAGLSRRRGGRAGGFRGAPAHACDIRRSIRCEAGGCE
ncbi:hypothetical protein PT2222_40182 [Paraburkholderia tropica]